MPPASDLAQAKTSALQNGSELIDATIFNLTKAAAEADKTKASELFHQLVELGHVTQWGGDAHHAVLACVYLARNVDEPFAMTTCGKLVECGGQDHKEIFVRGLAHHVCKIKAKLGIDKDFKDPVLLLEESLCSSHENVYSCPSLDASDRQWCRELLQGQSAAVLDNAAAMLGLDTFSPENLAYCPDAYAYASILISLEEVFGEGCPSRDRFEQAISSWCHGNLRPAQIALIHGALSPYTSPRFLRMDPEYQELYRAERKKSFLLPGTGHLFLQKFCAAYDD
ncbi:hypothetical protein JCM3766R1_000049 [Sporobolomyces carnicolor]